MSRRVDTDELMVTFVVRLALSAVLTLLIIGGVAAFGHHIAYWAAALIALVVVFGGFLILDGDWID